MTQQNEALRLADCLKERFWDTVLTSQAATELRRLHIENEAFGIHLSERMKDLALVEAQRDALLAALLWIDKRCPQAFMDCPLHTIHREMAHDAGACARAAIKAVEEGENHAKSL